MFRMSYTPLPIEAAIDAAVNAGIVPCGPEFVDAKGLRCGFRNLSVSWLSLADAGLVKTVCLRKPGATRGKRLWQCQSIREYLQANIDHRSK